MDKPQFFESEIQIQDFLYGSDNTEGIVGIEYDYAKNHIYLVIEDPITGKKKLQRDTLKPFLWSKDLKQFNFYQGDKNELRRSMIKHGVSVEPLITMGNERTEDGYKYLVRGSGSWNQLISFFKKGGFNIFNHRDKFQYLQPIEQYLIQTGKRFFKGFKDYDTIHRYVFDIETTGLEPEDSRCFMIGAKSTKDFNKIYAVEVEDDDDAERAMIIEWATDLSSLKPSIIAGYNSENFDFDFLIKRMEILGDDLSKYLTTLNPKKEPMRRKDATVKYGNETEYYKQTKMWGYNIIDIIHAVRKAQAINSEIKSASLKYIAKFSEVAKKNRVYIKDGKDIWGFYKDKKEFWFNEKTGEYRLCEKNPDMVDLDQKYPKIYKKVTGDYITERYLMDDLWETHQVDSQYNQASFMLANIIPTGYARVSTMGTATQWKLLMLGWSYVNGLAIPKTEEKRDYTGGLSRLLSVGYASKIVKFDFASLYPSIQITHQVYPAHDISKAMDKMLKFFHATRTECKAEAAKAYEINDIELATMFDRKQLPIKILNNSQYGSLCAPLIFPWADIDRGEEVTCRGRMYLRGMVQYFVDRGFETLVLDTDGVNFTFENVDMNFEYIGKGLNWKTVKDKQYKGLEAYCAEYNDNYMRGVMALDIDDVWETTINLSRKNYAGCYYKKGKLKYKKIGNSIKSKTMPTYCEDFIDAGVEILLDPNVDTKIKGQKWLELYYDSIEKIFNKQTPLIKIANKSKVKHTINEYVARSQQTNRNGGKLPKLAHMELVLTNNIHVNLGDVIYYVNDALMASHGDSGTHKRGKGITATVHPNSYILDMEEIENNPEITGSYNVPRAISTFNNKVKPFLVNFHPDIRDKILIKDPKDRHLFTLDECDLVRGFPIKAKDQDDFEEDLMKQEEKELKFWNMYYEKYKGNIQLELEDINDPSLPDYIFDCELNNKEHLPFYDIITNLEQ